jgi:hypothetical protein
MKFNFNVLVKIVDLSLTPGYFFQHKNLEITPAFYDVDCTAAELFRVYLAVVNHQNAAAEFMLLHSDD